MRNSTICAVDGAVLFIVTANKPKANHSHAHRRSQLKALVFTNPPGKKSRQPNRFAKASNHSFAAEAAENYPRLQRPKSPAKLDAVIHVIFSGFDGVATQNVRRGKRKDTAQSLQIAHIQHTEIERNEKTFVRIDRRSNRRYSNRRSSICIPARMANPPPYAASTCSHILCSRQIFANSGKDQRSRSKLSRLWRRPPSA